MGRGEEDGLGRKSNAVGPSRRINAGNEVRQKRQAEFLDQSSIWKALARRATGPRRVACPYVGEGASKLLPWKKGDVLVCALSKLNARAGNVCPAEIEKLREMKVEVYVEPDLHAKVMLLADHAVVGSANLSYHSRDNLDEAGVVLRDAANLAAIDAWFKARMVEPVTPGLLEECKKAYRKPKWPSLDEAQGTHSNRTLWIITTEPMPEFPADELAAASAARRAAEKEIEKPESHGTDQIRWEGGKFAEQVKKDDLVVQVWKHRGQHVSPHGRVLSVRRTNTRRGKTIAYVCIEYPQIYLDDPIARRVMTGGQLRHKCSSTLDLKLPSGAIERPVRNPAAQRALRGLCSPETIL